MSFTVTSVTDGDTFEVTPNWEWDDKSGSLVRPTGYNTPEEGEERYDEAKEWLADLIEGEEVELEKFATIDKWSRLVCDVYYDGKNLSDYWEEQDNE